MEWSFVPDLWISRLINFSSGGSYVVLLELDIVAFARPVSAPMDPMMLMGYFASLLGLRRTTALSTLSSICAGGLYPSSRVSTTEFLCSLSA